MGIFNIMNLINVAAIVCALVLFTIICKALEINDIKTFPQHKLCKNFIRFKVLMCIIVLAQVLINIDIAVFSIIGLIYVACTGLIFAILFPAIKDANTKNHIKIDSAILLWLMMLELGLNSILILAVITIFM